MTGPAAQPQTRETLVEQVARGLRAGREFINALSITDGASRRATDREFIAVELIPAALVALSVLAARLDTAERERDEERERAVDAETRVIRLQQLLETTRAPF